jgi:hypothetical protein
VIDGGDSCSGQRGSCEWGRNVGETKPKKGIGRVISGCSDGAGETCLEEGSWALGRGMLGLPCWAGVHSRNGGRSAYQPCLR